MTRDHRKTELLSLLAVLAVALAWRLLFFFAVQDTPLAAWHTWEQSDMFGFLAQARALAAGDWLARTPWHPYNSWMRVAPPAAWQAFFTRPAFYQAPLYSYWLALLMRLTADAALWTRIIQLACGVANVGLVSGITRRLFGRGAALAAGLIMAVYGPLLVIESQVLRDTMVLTLMLSVFFLYQSWTLDQKNPASPRWPLGLGLLLGILAMAHEGALLLTLAITLAAWLHLRRTTKIKPHSLNPQSAIHNPQSSPDSCLLSPVSSIPHSARWIALLALGAFLGYAPLMFRNLLVGAPLPPRFAGSAFAFAVANHATAAQGGAVWITPTPAFGETIARSGGNVPALVAGVLGSYHGEWWRWLGHWAMRLGALAVGAENAENVSQAYFALRVPILAFSVDFRLLLPLALTGAVLWGRRRWSAAARGGLPPLAMALDGLLVALMLSIVLPLGRYRLMLLPALLPFAGRGAVMILNSIHSHRWPRLARAAGLAGLFALGQWGLGRMLPIGELRPADFNTSAKILLDWGRPDLALRELAGGIQAGLDPAAFELQTAIALEAAGREAEAAAIYERILARPVKNPIALQRLAWLRATAHDANVRQVQQAGDLARLYASLKPADATEPLDLTAAAAAARGDFPAATAAAARALDAARRQGSPALAGQIARRLDLYRQGRPFVR